MRGFCLFIPDALFFALIRNTSALFFIGGLRQHEKDAPRERARSLFYHRVRSADHDQPVRRVLLRSLQPGAAEIRRAPGDKMAQRLLSSAYGPAAGRAIAIRSRHGFGPVRFRRRDLFCLRRSNLLC